ncbi:MAG: hypothetical protein AAGD25_05270 [Cyanobacteria bacterium P01_F01_bin.150]
MDIVQHLQPQDLGITIDLPLVAAVIEKEYDLNIRRKLDRAANNTRETIPV